MIFVSLCCLLFPLDHALTNSFLCATVAFAENAVITANPSKSGGDWWFGKTVQGGRTGLFPKAYVEVVNPGE